MDNIVKELQAEIEELFQKNDLLEKQKEIFPSRTDKLQMQIEKNLCQILLKKIEIKDLTE